MNLLIDQENAQKILNYLLSRPYGEVMNLVPGITRLLPAEAAKTEATLADSVADARKAADEIHDPLKS